MKNVFRISRWHYFPLYLLLLVLIGLYIYLYDSGIDAVSYVFLGLSIVLFLFLEVLIRSRTINVDKEVIVREGVFSPRINRLSHPSIVVDQNFVQRTLSFGDVKLDDIVLKGMMYPGRLKRRLEH